MRTLLWAGIICLASIWSVFGATTREERWRRVDNAQRQFLLKTALTELEAIIPEAAAAKAYGEVARAIAQKAKFQAIFEKENQVFEITLLEQLIGSAPPETLPLLHTLLANWKWDYFRDNRWRFVGRSPVEVSTHDSIATWDLRRLFDDIDREFQKALSAEGALQATPIAVFEDMFEMGKRPARYRPTLYDFVVHEALSFYSAGEQAGAATEDTFQILSDSPVLDPVDQFLSWRPVTTQTNSPLFKAIRLHQDLLRFHQEDLDPTAFIAADLARLIFGKEVATGENAVDRFRVAVQALAERWSEQEASADAFAEWAQLIKDDGDFVRAREIAQRGMRYPISPGGIVCQSLIDEIEQKEAFISTERVWHRKPQKIQVRYRNIERVHFRAYAVDWSVPAQQITNLISSLESFEAGKALTEKRPTFEWSHPLEPTQDFQFQETEVEVPSLPPGFYVIAAGSSSDFAGKPENRSATKVWVSDLAVILRPRANRLEGFVLDAERGDPIPNAAVQLWIRSGAKKDWKPLDARTDRDGFFDFDSAQVGDARLMRVETGQRLIGIDFEEDSHLIHPIRWREREDTSDPRQTILFTDRQIYRPGQLIHFKGLCLIADKEKSDYRVLPREEVKVVLHDPSQNEIKSLKLRSNKFGSFSGNFVIPHGIISGAWSIKIAEGPEGSSSVQIEEYKRPRFRVALDSPRLGTRLNERSTVTGTALNLTGAPVDGAEVRYLITRKVAMPWWTAMEGDHYRQLWRLTQSEAEETQIAQGQTRTDSHGRFEISFRASENPFLKKQEGIVYSFIIYSQVTGPAGETESEEKTIRVGKAALEAALEVGPWQTDNKPVVFRIRTQSLDGVGQPARGVVRVFSLQQPEKAQRPLPVRNGFDFYLDPISEWADRVKKDQSHQSNWPIAQEIASLPFMCNQSGDAQLSLKLPAGPYRAFLETEDSFGAIVKARGDVRVLDPGSKQFKIRLPSAVSVKSERLEPGQQLIAIWGSGYPHARACIEFEHRDKIIRR
ncbi:MAG: MG2 domain-containing protein, partial [Verrucomicrobiota bacterium]